MDFGAALTDAGLVAAGMPLLGHSVRPRRVGFSVGGRRPILAIVANSPMLGA